VYLQSSCHGFLATKSATWMSSHQHRSGGLAIVRRGFHGCGDGDTERSEQRKDPFDLDRRPAAFEPSEIGPFNAYTVGQRGLGKPSLIPSLGDSCGRYLRLTGLRTVVCSYRHITEFRWKV